MKKNRMKFLIIEFLLLLLFHAADQSDLAAQVVHGAMAGELV